MSEKYNCKTCISFLEQDAGNTTPDVMKRIFKHFLGKHATLVCDECETEVTEEFIKCIEIDDKRAYLCKPCFMNGGV